jgi:hypothetical protein
MNEAFPLSWPTGWKRTKPNSRIKSPFKASFASSRDKLLNELKLLNAEKVVLSSNITLRRDGLPYANAPEPPDPGAAVYFELKQKPMCLACDQYRLVRENIMAIAKTVEALRGIERWGASDMMERAFTGFLALPEKASTPWREVLELGGDRSLTREIIETQAKKLLRAHHPDRGGDVDKFQQIIAARDAARAEVKL